MVFDGFAAMMGRLFASDATLMVMSMLFGVLLGMLWSGRSFPRRIPTRKLRQIDLLRR